MCVLLLVPVFERVSCVVVDALAVPDFVAAGCSLCGMYSKMYKVRVAAIPDRGVLRCNSGVRGAQTSAGSALTDARITALFPRTPPIMYRLVLTSYPVGQLHAAQRSPFFFCRFTTGCMHACMRGECGLYFFDTNDPHLPSSLR